MRTIDSFKNKSTVVISKNKLADETNGTSNISKEYREIRNSSVRLTSVTSNLEQKIKKPSRINKFLVKIGFKIKLYLSMDEKGKDRIEQATRFKHTMENKIFNNTNSEKNKKYQEIHEQASRIIQFFEENDHDILPSMIDYSRIGMLKDNATEHFARTAFRLIRKRFKDVGVKSASKFIAGNAKSEKRLQRAEHTLRDVREKAPQSKEPRNYSYAWERAAGNCGEMSGIAVQLINKSGGYARRYLVDNKGTHVFALVGIPPKTATDNVHFSDYNGCWIVDPWAGIVCEASQYTKCFETKMNQWSKQNKMIYSPCLKSWVSANNADWLKAVTKNNKIPSNAIPYIEYSEFNVRL
ncbi:hypothetical protein Rin_00017830 [Candidatus Regiella insecticola 5.15]|uniref:Uncharacterized protein n=1 Tax=Candidatus Regiella insecticola 5.15 TaxID=1005043 RepID=G2H148_9ENTR|nr:hypothetical protein [Candidatus Regiella insecticola]EGY28291.1 hypothetical protein Rin_00017830 [Candidatus Regiella insecticola 5.15]